MIMSIEKLRRYVYLSNFHKCLKKFTNLIYMKSVINTKLQYEKTWENFHVREKILVKLTIHAWEEVHSCMPTCDSYLRAEKMLFKQRSLKQIVYKALKIMWCWIIKDYAMWNLGYWQLCNLFLFLKCMT